MSLSRAGLGLGLLLVACSNGAQSAPGSDGGDGAGPEGSGGGDAGGLSGAGGLGGSAGSAGENNWPPGVERCEERSETCGLRECTALAQPGTHVAACSELAPSTNPPTIGPHYPNWAQFGIYDEPILPGFFLHSLEHSAVALLYNCALAEAQGVSCDDLRAELVDFYNDWPSDPLCVSVPHRLMIVPAPSLPTAFAAVAWGYYLEGDCFDRNRVNEFVTAHYGQNYENICNAGINPALAGCGD